ncbi:gliding motility-associated C-terminal domain-containing protein [Dyadobacter sp. CY343]|uniref:gliding motility-associated C-terminal domain-containing protein n=1 Tax=Dyadobacter sp. CY343 TaxID=2907299 RepID=UPI001F20C420|nr:gliding motility-associated C-terminal domain-containing protein [Dyadobacter sp. CY343]MCE7059545.1 gliding motility-associated C-terminal domain-containing protein [Dyadobacter sp. CY343]
MKFSIYSALLLIFCLAQAAVGQSVRHTYRFYEDLAVAKPECGPGLEPWKALGSCQTNPQGGTYVDDRLPCGVQRKVYQNNMNWGLMYPNSEGAITDTYSIQMYIKVTDWGNIWARIIDFSNGALDEGIYFKSTPGSTDRCLDFYPSGITGTCPFFNKSTYYLLTFTRNGQTRIMDVYVDNTLFTSYDDSQGKYVGKAGTPIYLFRDDEQKPCESGTANFAYLSFTNKYFAQTEVDSTFKDICFVANINAYADFSISPNPSCGFPRNITVQYTGILPSPATGYTFNWEWDGARVISGSGMGPYVVSWDTGGSKNVALTVVNEACGNELYNRKQAVISSLDLTSTIVSGNCELGEKGTITLRGLEGIEPYQYSIDSVNYQTDSVFVVPIGSYRFFVKDQNNCTIAKDMVVEFNGDIELTAMADTTVCFGESISLNVTGNAQQYSWSPALGLDDPASETPVAAPAETTQYVVTAIKGSCSKSDTVTVAVAPKVQVNVTPDAVVEYNVPFQLTASSPQVMDLNGAVFAWAPPEGLNNPASQSPIAIVREDRSYSVELTAPNGCTGSATVNLSVKKTENISIPGVFTPNGDGKNEVLFPVLFEMATVKYFKIYNRWGEVVFYTDQINNGWDGRYKGANPVNGTYVWEIEGTSLKGKVITRKGSVLLIK